MDGFLWGSRDLYSSSASEETFTISCYTDTAHTLEIRNRLDKNLASSGRKLSFKEVEVTTAYGVQNIAYTYDALSRVTNAAYYDGQALTGTPTREYAYTYDRASNRTNETLLLNGSQQYSHDFTYNSVNQLTNSGFIYDNNGNLTNDGAHSYTWDRANRLTNHNGSSYAYNGLGQRVSQTVSSIVTQYLQDTQPALFRVLKSDDGTNVNRFVHDPRGILAQNDSSNNWEWVVTDGLGSLRGVYDEAGAELETRRYAPYGELFEQTGTPQMPYGYTGEWEDQNDLLYLRARYLDRSTGNFISQDPLELANRYGYTLGNPIGMVDLYGEAPTPPNSCDISPIESFNLLADGADAYAFLLASVYIELGPFDLECKTLGSKNATHCCPDQKYNCPSKAWVTSPNSGTLTPDGIFTHGHYTAPGVVGFIDTIIATNNYWIAFEGAFGTAILAGAELSLDTRHSSADVLFIKLPNTYETPTDQFVSKLTGSSVTLSSLSVADIGYPINYQIGTHFKGGEEVSFTFRNSIKGHSNIKIATGWVQGNTSIGYEIPHAGKPDFATDGDSGGGIFIEKDRKLVGVMQASSSSLFFKVIP